MRVVADWARKEKTPIPRKEIMKAMGEKGTKSFTIINALNALMRKGYIRKGFVISNKTYFVMLKSVGRVGIDLIIIALASAIAGWFIIYPLVDLMIWINDRT